MLQTKQQHFRRAQNPGISYNVFLLVHYEKLLLIIVYSRRLRNATDRINTAFFVTKLK
jgi:hypothetical protein